MIEVTCPKCKKAFRCERPSEETNYTVICPYCGVRCRISPNPAPEKKPHTKRNLYIIIGIAIVLVVGIAVALLLPRSNKSAPETTAAPTDNQVASSPEPTPYQTPELSPEEYAAAIAEEKNNVEKDTYNEISFEELARYPDNHNAEAVKLSGTVIQVIEDAAVQSEGYGLNEYRIAVNGDYNDIIYVRYQMAKSETRILEDDNVTLYGLSCGLYSYNSFAGNVTLPLIEAQLIEVGE